MPLFSKKERNEMKGCPVLRDFVMEQTFDLVNFFYPGQWLVTTIREEDIMNITGWNYIRADEILKKIRKKEGKDYVWYVTMSELCNYLDIDDMLMQVFLASLNNEPLPPALQVIAADRTKEPLRRVCEARKELRQGIIIHMPLELYNELNPLGEAMYKKRGFHRAIVRPYEIAQIFEIHIDTAREMLRQVRSEEGLPARAYVSIEKFCKVHYMNIVDFRYSLASIHEDWNNEKEED